MASDLDLSAVLASIKVGIEHDDACCTRGCIGHFELLPPIEDDDSDPDAPFVSPRVRKLPDCGATEADCECFKQTLCALVDRAVEAVVPAVREQLAAMVDQFMVDPHIEDDGCSDCDLLRLVARCIRYGLTRQVEHGPAPVVRGGEG